MKTDGAMREPVATRVRGDDATGCRALWSAVLLRALEDLIPSKAKRNDRRKIAERARGCARRWIHGECAGFYFACGVLGLEPDYVRLVAADVEAHGALPVNAVGLKKHWVGAPDFDGEGE